MFDRNIYAFISMWRNEFSFIFRLMRPIVFTSTHKFVTSIGLGICQNKYCKIFSQSVFLKLCKTAARQILFL